MKVFPIKTETACQFKWAWSTIFLSRGTTSSCHRCHHWEFDASTLKDFHNLPGKIEDREKMLKGEWPGNGCEYCQKVELANGSSERTTYINDLDLVPMELESNPNATKVTPRLLEVYFTSLCNQACVYCTPLFSSTIENEFDKYGPIESNIHYSKHVKGKHINEDDYPIFLSKFWEWMEENSSHLYEFQILGGEPLFQDEFDQCLDFFDKHPNKNLTWRIFSNLKHNTKQFKTKIDKIKKLIDENKIKEFQMVCSIDCWGEQAEFVRYGMSLKNWEDNFKILVETEKIGIHVHMTVTPLTLPTMPDLIEKVKSYRTNMKGITFSSNTVYRPYLMNIYNFGSSLSPYLEKAIEGLNTGDNHDRTQKECLEGILQTLNNSTVDLDSIKNFIDYLDELDKRRNTDWKTLFPEIYAMSKELISK